MLVEAAFALPVLLVFLLGFVDFSIWEFQNSQASSAARDGARVGILLPLNATATKSQAQNQADTKAAITAAAKAKIPGSGKLTNFTVNVWCEGGTKTVDFSGCDNATPGTTRLNVAVSWRYSPISPIGAVFGKPTISSSAGMVYVGARRDVDPAVAFACNTVFDSPSGTVLAGATLSGNMTVGFTTDGAADCTGFSVRLLDSNGFPRGSGSVSYSGTTGLITFTPGQVSGLAPGSYTVELSTSSGTKAELPITLTDAPVCAVSPGTPTGTTLAGSTLAGTLTVGFTTDGSADCIGFSVRLLDANGNSMGSGSVSYAGTSGSASFTSAQVTGLAPGAYTIELATGSGHLSTVPVSLTAAPACQATVAINPASQSRSGNNLTSNVVVSVQTQNCAGSLTVELWLQGTPNKLYQTKSVTVPPQNFSTSFDKQKSSNAGNANFVAGTYQVRVNSGAVLVGSATMTVNN